LAHGVVKSIFAEGVSALLAELPTEPEAMTSLLGMLG
jgi:hypothetical protein